MSIGKRFVNLIRANVNAIFERGDEKSHSTRPIEELSDDEVERELLRRKARREAAEHAAAWEEVEQVTSENTGRFRTRGRRTSSSFRRAPGGASGSSSAGAARRTSGTPPPRRDPRLAQLYAQLECPYGADLTTVRKHYRKLMLKYHPDMHSGHPEKQRLATDLSQRLTMAYNELRRVLSPHP